MTTVPLGFGQQEARLPGHLSLFHDSYPELRALQREFLRIGIDDPEEGVALIGAPGVPAQLRRDLEADLGRSLEAEVRRGKLALVESDPDPDEFLERFRQTFETLDAQGYALTRALGRVSWGLSGFPAPEDQLWLESRLNSVIAASHVILLCAYDLCVLPGQALAYGGLETHPQIVLAGRVVDNPTFVEAGPYFAERLLGLPWLASSGRSGEAPG